ncbi:MAG: CBS domain-containing protein [Flavobacterium sp.]|uniref:CBS domain-containing protein n=1 Tax=Flavobacterium sp. TaxID=239 RepID=UPI0022BD23B3|nr:CBS domain-containing protein [Flavobacterium sp.]MCZ8297529.1 CBS domain-containing protein [Flavobacterium sp.]
MNKNNLETEPYYVNAWIDGEIILKHKAKAKSKLEKDPILKISILPSANKPPITINRDAKISDAVTLMMMHNFSQLPVMSNPKSVAGFISWETIGIGTTNGLTSTDVRDYLKDRVVILDLDTPLLDAIKTVIKEEIVLVQKKDKSLSGIVTITDISSQFFTLTEPFLLLEKIENLIRLLLDEKFLVEEIKELCKEDSQNKENIEFIDDLTFGQYIRLIEKEENWIKLNLKIERVPFIKQLNKIREIRNDIMHFDPEGISQEQRDDLINMSNFLTELIKYN